MSSDQPIVLRLEVDPKADPITGRLGEGGLERRSFTGWLELTDAIEAIRAAHGEVTVAGKSGGGNR